MNVEQRIKALENFVNSLKNSSTIPYEVDKSFFGNGFLQSRSFLCGNGTLDGSGEAIIPVPEASVNNIAITNRPYTSYVRQSTLGTNINELFVGGGDPADEFNYVIFLFSDRRI